MLEEVEYCQKTKKENFNKEIIVTAKDEENFKIEKKYHICDEEYTKKLDLLRYVDEQKVWVCCMQWCENYQKKSNE